jgi:hypothetical protein
VAEERPLVALPQHRLEQAERTATSHRPDAREARARWGRRGLGAVIGAATWAAGVGVIVAGPAHPGSLVVVLLCLPLIGAAGLAMNGWSWFSQYRFGTYWHSLKRLALMAVAVTGVGLIPICYWTGLAILRLAGNRLL